jgi:hypothetical protein
LQEGCCGRKIRVGGHRAVWEGGWVTWGCILVRAEYERATTEQVGFSGTGFLVQKRASPRVGSKAAEAASLWSPSWQM